MNDSPYAPPVAHVEDAPVHLGPPPRQVKLALALLWTTLALAVPLLAVQHHRADAFSVGSIGFSVALLGAAAALFVRMRRGRNWARIVYLLFVLLSGYVCTQVAEPFGPTVLEQATNALSWLLTAIAIGLLFIPQPSRHWFRSARRQG